ncbi:MAG: aminotransferase class V-fold PLP-dependent enzyme, partial [Planctomycetota bacterium]|nr:aminotransferase class V-fold PLP-dependent enzyme [Planctomycetota bacterium]
WVNNETGAIQNIRELKNIAASNNVRWHCDAVQGIGKIPFDQDLLATDSFCFSGHKFGAPKGVGLVRLANPTAIEPLFWGGAQQDSIRPGTESPELAASFTTALVDCVNSQPEYQELNLKRRQQLLQLLDDSAVDYLLNTPITDSIPNTLNLSFSNIDGRMLLPALDVEKISISSGSACASGAAAASSVLMACGVNEKLAQASIRLSFVHNYSAQELEQGMGVFVKVLKALYKVANP